MARIVNTEPTSCAQLPMPLLHPIMATWVTSPDESSAHTVITRISTKLLNMPKKIALRTFFASPPSPCTACGTEKKAKNANIAMPK